MENRTAIRGARASKGLVVLFAVIVAIGLGVIAAFVAKSFTGPAAATESPLVQSTYSGPGPDAQERNTHRAVSPYTYDADGKCIWYGCVGSLPQKPSVADDKPSSGHGQLP
jgi:hypothetical protein